MEKLGVQKIANLVVPTSQPPFYNFRKFYDWLVLVMPREGIKNILTRATFSKQNETVKYSRIGQSEAHRFLVSDDESDAQRSIRTQLKNDGYRYQISKFHILKTSNIKLKFQNYPAEILKIKI